MNEKQWLTVAFFGLTQEQRNMVIDMQGAEIMRRGNLFDERDAMRKRIAELEAKLAVSVNTSQPTENEISPSPFVVITN